MPPPRRWNRSSCSAPGAARRCHRASAGRSAGRQRWWGGKQFLSAEKVHPLLFPTRDGNALWAMNPVLAFGGLGVATKLPFIKHLSLTRPVTALRPVLRTSASKARLRTTRYRGVDTATMIYDQLPINDVFRKLSEDEVIGAMDLRGVPPRPPYFFVLRRDTSLPVL